MKKSIQGIKENIDDIKQSVDEMKVDIQGTVDDAKHTADDVKETIEGAKTASQQLKGSMSNAKENFREIGKSFQSLRQSVQSQPAVTLELRKEGNGFVIRDSEGLVGEITYAPIDDSTWVLDHTYVTPQYRGRDIAQRLLQRVAAEARKEEKKIIPSCSYALVQFKRHIEYADVWKK